MRVNMSHPVRQFLVAFIPVAVVIIAVAYAFMDLRRNAQVTQITTAERTNLHQLSGFMAAETATSINQLRGLIREEDVRSAINSPSPGTMTSLQSAFLTMARSNLSIQQIRWIDEKGIERARVMRDGEHLSVADDKDLRDTSDQGYFNATKSLLEGEMYVSDFDFILAHGQGDLFTTPTLQVATPVYENGGQERGIVIINIAMQYLLDTLRIAQETNTGTSYALLNSNGYGLSTSEQQDQIGLQTDYPGIEFSGQYPVAWGHISNSDTGTAELDDGLWIWDRLTTEDIIRRLIFAGSVSDVDIPSIHMGNLSLKLVAHKTVQSLNLLHQQELARMTTIPGALLLLAAYAWGLVYFLRGQTIKRQADIEVAHATAREKHMERLKELEERFHLLVEASSVGMVVADADGNIIMSNSAAENMLGYEKEQLTGMNVDQLLPPTKRSLHARMRSGFMRNPAARSMGQGRKLEALIADGSRIPVEVGLNPFRDHGKTVVLASIIDLSK